MLSASQIAEWEAFNRLEPIGKFRDDYRTALLCSLLVNMFSDKKSKKAKLTDFLLNWDNSSETIKTQSIDEMKSILDTLGFKKKKQGV